MKQKAVRIALSDKLRSKELIALDFLKLEKPKTKTFAGILEKLKIKGKVLVSFADTEKESVLASRNIRSVKNIFTKDLNVMDLLNNKYLLLSKESINFLEKKFGNKI
jgi:large subunit ribosomal protein L4